MKRTTSNKSPQLKLTALAAAGLLLGFSQYAAAAGTLSNTTIGNLATLNYSVGGVAQTAIGSSAAGNTTGAGTATTFLVDNKVNVTVVEGNSTFTSVVPGALTQVTTFTVNNLGNTVQDYALSTANLASGTVLFANTDNFDGTGCNFMVDANNNGLADDATGTFIDELIPDASKTVFVVCNIPATQVNNDYAVVSLTATTAVGGTAASQGAAVTQTAGADTAGVDVVFADVAGTDDAVRDGKGSARDAYKVVSATLSVQKVVTPICDPFNGNTNPKNIPGAAVQWAITIRNTGAAAATLATVTDTLNAALAFDTKLISGAGAPPATTCTNAGGASLSASGFGAVTGVGATTYAAPGIAGQATTAGATIAGQNITINYGTLAAPAVLLPAGSLAAGNFITVYFNTFVQ